jgi:hypothetical protein
VVYLGDGRTEPVTDHLDRHPRPGYAALDRRLRDLAVGPRGDRAGDVLVIARYGDEPDPADRYYFGHRYHSMHGGPGRGDSEIPLIVAHPRKRAAELERLVRSGAGRRTDATEIAPLIERILTAPRR